MVILIVPLEAPVADLERFLMLIYVQISFSISYSSVTLFPISVKALISLQVQEGMAITISKTIKELGVASSLFMPRLK